MKKTIAALAVLASTNAHAMIPPNGGKNEKVCLEIYKLEDKSIQVGGCDETRNNELAKLNLKENGCAKGQVSMYVAVDSIRSCLPPGVVQL